MSPVPSHVYPPQKLESSTPAWLSRELIPSCWFLLFLLLFLFPSQSSLEQKDCHWRKDLDLSMAQLVFPPVLLYTAYRPCPHCALVSVHAVYRQRRPALIKWNPWRYGAQWSTLMGRWLNYVGFHDPVEFSLSLSLSHRLGDRSSWCSHSDNFFHFLNKT